MYYEVKILGNGKVLINKNYVVSLGDFIQRLREDDRYFNREFGFGYRGE